MTGKTEHLAELTKRVVQFLRGDKVFERILINSTWLLSANVITAALGFVQSILVARALGVEQFGVLGVVIAFVTVLKHLTSFRMNEFVVKYVSDELAEHRKNQAAAIIKLAMTVEGVASLLAYIIAIVMAPLGAFWFVRVPDAHNLIIAYATVILGGLISETAIGILQVFNQFRFQSLITSVGKIVMVTAVVFAFFFHGGLWGILLAYMIGNLVPAILLLAGALRETSRQLGRGWWKASFSLLDGRWRSVLHFTLSTNLSATLSIIVKESDALWIGYFRNPAEVGYYKLAASVVSLLQMPISPLAQTIYPEIARKSASRQWNDFRSILRRGSSLAAIYFIPAGLFFSVSSTWLIGVLYGNEFTPAALAAIILLIGLAAAEIFFWIRPALLALGRPDYPLKINLWITILKVIGVFILLPRFGYIGNAALMAGLYLFGTTLAVHKTFTLTRVSSKAVA